MKSPSKKQFRKAAWENYNDDGTIEIDSNAKVSVSEDGGAYIQAWVWIDDEIAAEVKDVEF